MSLSLRDRVPRPVKTGWRLGRNLLVSKTRSELGYWRDQHAIEGRFRNGHYERLMLGMAGESDAAFLSGKIVADFGCGPRGSLVWASQAALRIGIDVLADSYCDEFSNDVLAHGMIYLKSTEKAIPLPTGFVDIMFTLNAVDHVDDLPRISAEIIRVIKPGGLFIGSFNLEEPATSSEPQRLNEEAIKHHILDHLEIESYRVTARPDHGYPYAPFVNGLLPYRPGERGYLWVRARKDASHVGADGPA